MAEKEESKKLQTFRTEYRKLIGSAIIDGLISPDGPGTVAFQGHDQNGNGGYTQIGDVDYDQNGGGDYNQAESVLRNPGSFAADPGRAARE